jgi:hypothetical protein
LNLACLTSLIPEKPLNALLAASGDYSKCPGDLDIVVNSSEVGAMMYSFALGARVAKSVKDVFEKHIKLFLECPSPDRGQLSTCKYNAIQEAQSLDNIDLIPPRRDAAAPYGSSYLVYSVTSIIAEGTFRFAVAWKQEAALQKSLEEVWGEKLLGDPKPRPWIAKPILAEMCADANFARQAWNAYVGELPDNCGADKYLQLLKSKKRDLLGRDPEFICEVAMMETLCGAQSENRLMEELLHIFPTVHSLGPDVSDVFQQISAMLSQPIVRLASKQAQVKVNTIKRMLGRMVDGRSPDFTAVAGDLVIQKVVNVMPLMVTWQVGFQNECSGTAALTEVYKKESAAYKAGGPSNCDVSTLKAFHHWIDPTIVHDVDTIIKGVDKQSNVSAAAVVKQETNAGKDHAVNEAMSMFS